MIAHVDMDAFYASVEALDRPELLGKPVIVGGSTRGVVSAASYEARRYGVHSAMPIFQARRLCPQGIFIPPRMERYQQVSRKVMEVLSSFSPLVEPISVDEAFLDLSGTEALWGSPGQTAVKLKTAMRESTGLKCSVGIAPLRFLAKIASDRDKPDGLVIVEDLEAFLATVLLEEVSGVGKGAQKRLGEMGLSHLIQVRELGPERTERVLGSFGRRLWELANGIDPTGVNPGRDVKSVSHEVTLIRDTADRDLIEAHMLAMSQKVCRRLRRKGLCAGTVTIKLKHTDFKLVTRSKSLAQASDQTRDIFAAARELLRQYKPGGPFRLIGVGASGLVTWDRVQTPLWEQGRTHKDQAVSRAEDLLVSKFGEKALIRAGAMPALKGGPKKK